MNDPLTDSLTLSAHFCSQCGRGLAAHWKFCAGCGQDVALSAAPADPAPRMAPDLDALLRATAAAKAARPGTPGGWGERTLQLSRLDVTLMGTPEAAFEAERSYRRGLEAARAFQRSRRAPPASRDLHPALVVLSFALITGLAIFVVFLFVQRF